MVKPVIHVEIDLVTSAILAAYAKSRRQSLEEAIAALLYRQAAVMSGWPGQAGQELERAMLGQMLPEPDELVDLPL